MSEKTCDECMFWKHLYAGCYACHYSLVMDKLRTSLFHSKPEKGRCELYIPILRVKKEEQDDK